MTRGGVVTAAEILDMIATSGIPDDGEPPQGAPACHGHTGTYHGYKIHLQHGHTGDQVCPPCRRAARDYHREYKRRTQGCVPRGRTACGTKTGYDHHYKYGEEPCQACRAANSTYRQNLRKRKQAARAD